MDKSFVKSIDETLRESLVVEEVSSDEDNDNTCSAAQSHRISQSPSKDEHSF